MYQTTYTFDVETIVDLAIQGDRDSLRELLADEYSQYSRGISIWSEFVQVTSAATSEVRHIVWNGPLDDDPWIVLVECCPHPFADCWGYCECCGGDMEVDEE
jgi:hypothetical protein